MTGLSGEGMTSKPVRIVQISDLHLVAQEGGTVGGVDPFATLRALVTMITDDAWRPDLVIATGDLSDDGSAESYRRVRGLLAGLGLPVYCIPGNHDAPAEMRTHLPGGLIRLERSVGLAGWRIILLDSKVAGYDHGHCGKQELDALDDALRQAEGRHTVVALHHGPLPLCCMPQCQLDNAQEFMDTLGRHPVVRAVVAGHTHCEADTVLNGIRVMIAPSTCVQASHPVGPDVPKGARFMDVHTIDTARQGYRRLELHADGSIQTSVVWANGAGESWNA